MMEPDGSLVTMYFMELQYALKSILPRSIQIGLRKIFARRKRSGIGDVWPILESAGTTPPGWKGWPDGRQFAVVLTHDVETARGVERCRKVMDIEERLGFRSAFYFVPERYPVPAELRQEMVQRGFEVGVHGLRHDLSLFRSKKEFERQAVAINRYLKDWNAVGFRCPYMIRNLVWLHDALDIEYDSSTFDTDPFELQPSGVGTIFPFTVDRGPRGEGKVELPYTLSQDLTLFVLLGETGIDVWKTKLDWIGDQGGMALLDTHPDYMQPDPKIASDEYPCRNYEEFLEYVSTRYAGQYWQALPREVAAFVAKSKQAKNSGVVAPRSILNNTKAAMVVFSHYPADARVRRAAEALSEAGATVDVVCLRNEGEAARETIRGVDVFRLPVKQRRSSKGRYFWEYALFMCLSFIRLSNLYMKKRYQVVHIHNMPDVLVFTALIPKLCGAKVILDLHDPTPEVFMTKYRVGPAHWSIRLLAFLERLSLKFANLAITPNIAFRDLFISRGCPSAKIGIVMNTPQEHIFSEKSAGEPVALKSNERPFVLMYHGLVVERHGLDTALDAVARIRHEIPHLNFKVYGSGDGFVDTFRRRIQELDLSDVVQYYGHQSHEIIAEQIQDIDVGVIPNKRSSFTELNFPTRIFEYLAVGKPLIAPRTKGIRDYFDDESLFFFEPGEADSLAATILKIYRDPGLTASVLRRGQAVYQEHLWNLEKAGYLQMILKLDSNGS